MKRFPLLYGVLLICAASLTLSACSSGLSHYSKTGGYGKASLPGGNGGYRKTGKPYKIAGRTYYPLESARGYDETGVASWYGRDFHGKKTANGERYDMHALSAAHKTLPLPTLVRVTNLENGRSMVVRVNDRGPFVKSRLIDLSYAAAKALGYDQKGTTRVRVQALDGSQTSPPSYRQPAPAPVPARPVRPAAPPAPILANSSVASAPPIPGMYIQLGAFGQNSNADRLRSTLASDYPSVGVQPFWNNQQRLYRVRIGPYEDVQEIERTVLELGQKGYANAIVVIE